MSGDIGDFAGAAGDAVLGGAAAKVVESEAGGVAVGKDGHTHENACLNCDTPLQGAHCHNCGQKAHVHRTLRGFMHDLVHGVLHFEGKFWRTLPLLIWRPGRVMREYIEGKRAKYVSPVALFLFTVFVSFAIFSAAGGFGEINPEIDSETAAQLQENLKGADERIASLNNRLLEEGLTDSQKANLREEIASATTERSMLTQMIEAAEVTDNPDGIVQINPSSTPAVDGEASIQSTDAIDQATSDEAGAWLNSTWKKATANPGLLLYKLQTNAYKLSWLLIPLSLPFMWLLFPFSRRFKMYDHTVVVTYSISFMTMLAVVLSFGIAFELWPLIVGPLLYAPFHLYRSLRGAYSLSRFGALWRMFALSFGIWVSLALFVMIMLGIVVSA